MKSTLTMPISSMGCLQFLLRCKKKKDAPEQHTPSRKIALFPNNMQFFGREMLYLKARGI